MGGPGACPRRLFGYFFHVEKVPRAEARNLPKQTEKIKIPCRRSRQRSRRKDTPPMKRTIRQTGFPILTAFIWGTAFTAQSVGADYVGPLTFNALRSLIAFFALLVLDLAAARLIPGRRSLFQLAKAERWAVLIGGGACGMMLTIASYLQQLGL